MIAWLFLQFKFCGTFQQLFFCVKYIHEGLTFVSNIKQSMNWNYINRKVR